MIVVKVEIWPFGDKSQARTIGCMEIANVGGDLSKGEYKADFKCDSGLPTIHLSHNRFEGAWTLVSKALQKALLKVAPILEDK